MVYQYDICRETRTFLAQQLVDLSDDEQKEWLNNITSHIQSQGLPTPNVEIKHIELAIKVLHFINYTPIFLHLT